MKRISLLVVVVLAGGLLAVQVRAGVASGRVAGRTQITFGCPGPARAEGPPCERWLVFPHGRFRLARLSQAGEPIPNSRRLVSSDDRGRFTLGLPAGRYLLTPLAQGHARGGAAVTVRVRAGASISVVLRFQGFPQML